MPEAGSLLIKEEFSNFAYNAYAKEVVVTTEPLHPPTVIENRNNK